MVVIVEGTVGVTVEGIVVVMVGGIVVEGAAATVSPHLGVQGTQEQVSLRPHCCRTKQVDYQLYHNTPSHDALPLTTHPIITRPIMTHHLKTDPIISRPLINA